MFTCDQCEKSFTEKHNLLRHLKSHLTVQDAFSCDQCGKDFTRPDNLHRHRALPFSKRVSRHSGHSTSGCPHIISRAEWGARAPKHAAGHLAAGEPHYVFIHHGASSGCYTKTDCINKVRSYQNYHMDGHGWSDIGYSFVVGEDGNVYEARGWDKVGAHTLGYNSVGIAICVIGNFQDHVPNDKALNAIKSLIDCGVKTGKIPHSYVLKGHRDVGQTACPGQKLYDLIHNWTHFRAGKP